MAKKAKSPKTVNVLTRVARGIAFGDVSNSSIRNILTEISKQIAGRLTNQEMLDTLDYFDWRCPYTGKDLRPLIEGKLGGYVTDHIYPQSRVWCGLNVKGNLVIVDKEANSAKDDADIETFLLTDTKVLTDIDVIGRTRQERLDKIRAFQADCKYDPERIRDIVAPLMEKRYEEVRKEQEQWIEDTMAELSTIGIRALTPATTSFVSTGGTSRASSTVLEFFPADKDQFKAELLVKKQARFVLFYDTGAVKTTVWKATAFDADSNLIGNIQSRPFWRSRKADGLIKVEVHID